MDRELKNKKEAIRKLWHRGVLHWKLNDGQIAMYEMYKNTDKRILTYLISRRFGKSHVMALIATELCLQKPNAIVKFLCPTQKMVKTILVPIMRTILEDCPKVLRPEHLVNDGIFRFPNGSEIQFAGNDGGKAERLRGGYSNLCIVDEAGFCDDLSYTVRSVLLPTVATTGGKIILSSTPPKSPGHEFIDFVKQAEENGTLIKRTIYDNKMFTPAQVYEIIDSFGGPDNNEFQREYLCNIQTDTEHAVIPEFTEKVQQAIVKAVPRPHHFDYYVAADIGFKDLTVVLFGYLDFRNAQLVIEDEIAINRMTTQDLAQKIKEKEARLLYSDIEGEVKEPTLRVSDTNLIVINDLRKLHNLNFQPTEKDNKEAAINNLRILIDSHKIVINPKCVTLIKHLKNATWNKARNKFERTADGHHADAVDALIYMTRNIMWNKNPYPSDYNFDSRNSFAFGRPTNHNEFDKHLQTIFKVKKSV